MQCVGQEKEKAAIKKYCACMDCKVQQTLKYPVKKRSEKTKIFIFDLQTNLYRRAIEGKSTSRNFNSYNY